MNKLREQFRQKLLGQLSDANTEVDINNAVEVFKDFSISFSLFCAENYIHLHSDRWIKYLGDDKEFETEELYNKFIESYDKKSN